MNFGSVQLADDRWVVRCEPHVRARLKRVFPRCPQQAAGEIPISNTPENCRDLLWFLDRYPMAVEPAGVLECEADEHRRTEAAVAELLSFHRPPLDIRLAEPAREYQRFAASLLEVKGGLLVADDVGLGKTVTAICSMTIPENLPVLVVCPTQLPRQWAAMIARFAPGLSVHILTKGRPYAITKAMRGGEKVKVDGMPDVIITNYHKLRGWAETLAGSVRLVVFDECQQLRGRGSDIYSAVRHVGEKAHRRLGLSATPIYNYGSEFYWVVNALQPGALGERDEFVREWCTSYGGDKARLSSPDQFGAYLRREGIMLRRTRSEVGRELPELTKVVHTIQSDAAALDALKGDAIELARIVVRQNELYAGEKMRAAGMFDALMRQATGIAKAPYVAEFVKLLLDSERRVVLYGWHREVYGIWMEALKHFNPVLYTGTESPNQKAESIRAFTQGYSRVIIISLRAAAGLDGLQGHVRTGVFGELDWSPGVHEQCVGRFHRDGQDEPCVAYFLVSEDGADPIMTDVLGIKREQIEGVRNPDRALAERIDTGENSIRRLAREFLVKRGVPVEEERDLVFAGAEACE